MARRRFTRSRKPLSKKQVKAVKTIIVKEKKKYMDNWYEKTVSSTTSTTATVTQLTDIPQGDDVTNMFGKRQGNRIAIRSLQLKGYLTCADATNLVRVILLQWHGDADSVGAPTQASILDTFTSSANPLNAFYVNQSNANQLASYKILMDKRFTLTQYDSFNKYFSKIIKWKKPMELSFDNVAGTDYVNNSLWLMTFSDSSAVTHPGIEFTSRVKFSTTNV